MIPNTVQVSKPKKHEHCEATEKGREIIEWLDKYLIYLAVSISLLDLTDQRTLNA
jgi:hypothetical protein